MDKFSSVMFSFNGDLLHREISKKNGLRKNFFTKMAKKEKNNPQHKCLFFSKNYPEEKKEEKKSWNLLDKRGEKKEVRNP